MKKLTLCVLCVVIGMCAVTLAQSQTAATKLSVVPNFVKFSGAANDLNGNPQTGTISVTFALYKDQQGGAPLWLETQDVPADRSGHYTVSLGATKTDGLPSELFASGDARWLGVQLEGQAEQPRVLLLSVPYALKAVDADTVGGLPPSAFVLAAPPNTTASTTSTTSDTNASPVASPSSAVTGTGTVNFLPLWDATSDIISSTVFQSGSGAGAKIGINTKTPTTALDVKGSGTIRGVLSLPVTGTATASAGKNSQPLSLVASAFNSASSAVVGEFFNWQAEPAGNNTPMASATLNLLFGSGPGKPVETGLKFASNGLITFAPGQTFPGTGTGRITGVTAGSDLTGGGTTGTVTLNLDTTKVPLLASANTFNTDQTVKGNLTLSGSGNRVIFADWH